MAQEREKKNNLCGDITLLNRIITWKIVIILLFINIFLIGKDYLTTGVKVELSNNSGSMLKAIEVYYSEGIHRISVLHPQEKTSFQVHPLGETGIVVRWFDEIGKEYFVGDLAYIMRIDRGVLTIDFRPNGRLSSHEDYSAW